MTVNVEQDAINIREELSKRGLNSRFTDAQIDEAIAAALSPAEVATPTSPQASSLYNTSDNSRGTETNVASITDGGTASWTVNFTNAFSDISYAVVGTSICNTLTRGGDIVGMDSGGGADEGRTTGACEMATSALSSGTSNAVRVDRDLDLGAVMFGTLA